MLNWLDQKVPLRYIAFFGTVALWVISALQLVVGQASLLWVLLLTGLVVAGAGGQRDGQQGNRQDATHGMTPENEQREA